jgi:hypothetical protein
MMQRFLILLASVVLLIGIALLEYQNPPFEESFLTSWNKHPTEGESAIFQHSPLKVLSIQGSDRVTVSDIYGNTLTCLADLNEHPAIRESRSINAELIKKDGLCNITKSAVSSGHHKLKLFVSALFTLGVFLFLIRRFRFDAAELAIVNKE